MGMEAGASRFLVSRTVTFRDRDPWPGPVDMLDELGYIERRVQKFPRRMHSAAYAWCEFQCALHLLRMCRGYAGVAVGRYGIWFPILRRLLGLNKRVVMMDTEWQEVQGGRLNRAAVLASFAVCCNTRIEIERYSRRYGIPPEKFVFVPLAFQAGDLCEASDEGYIFAGGNQGRDWKTFAPAVDGLGYQVKVFTRNNFPNAPANTTVQHVTRGEFFRQMAAASCVVLPLLPEPLRVTGTTCWTAAMAMGKVVIVTEPYGAPDFMEHGVSGFYLKHGDVEGLRDCIQLVMQNPELRKRVGEAARERAWREFSPDAFRQRVLALLSATDGPERPENA
jgi:glycosyltransferase involved in cell wall biosynthesis